MQHRHTIAANTEPGSNNDEILKSLIDLSNNWDCTITNSLERPNENTPQVVKSNLLKAINLARLAPSLLFYDYRCNRSLIWIIWDPVGEVRNPS
jgi:hypothetical protein